ncbi:MAG: hypothetical protein IT306_09845 [Chloroflexi bacterium]|nr:hypothetical protein [Chloroflexota bacterium]
MYASSVQRTPRRPAPWLLTIALAGLLVLGVGCRAVDVLSAAAPPASPPPTSRVVEWEARDYSYDAPDTLPSGWVTIRMMNHGPEPHHGQLLRLNDGVTFQAFSQAMQEEGEAALRLTTLVGGPGAIDAHRTDEVTLDLKPGSYAIACFVPSPDGVLHLAKGMMKPVEVTATDPSTAGPPTSQGRFTMRDFSFEMPDRLAAGRASYEVANAGPQPHELVVVKLADGKSVADVMTWYRTPSGPPPFEAVGGINGLSTGQTGYMTLDLQPGAYAAICLVPDPASGQAHLHLGMAKAFAVQ